jgi:hypothetical protein
VLTQSAGGNGTGIGVSDGSGGNGGIEPKACFQPALHTLEVAFRNEISRAATRINDGRNFRFRRINSWLDAEPTMLMKHEQDKVDLAMDKLGTDARSQTEGHLIAKLDFGFWVALCRDSYTDTRSGGPRLWPRALNYAFLRRPDTVTMRAQLLHHFDPIRQFRNRIAHHEPVWDRDYLANYEAVLEGISWMSPKLANTVRVLCTARQTFDCGAAAFRPVAETIIGAKPGLPKNG